MYSVNFETLLVSLLEKWTKAVRRKRYFGRFYWILLKYEFFHFSCKFLPISLLAVDTFPALILLAAKQLPAGVTWSPSKFLTCTFGTVTFSVPFGCHYSTKDCKKFQQQKTWGHLVSFQIHHMYFWDGHLLIIICCRLPIWFMKMLTPYHWISLQTQEYRFICYFLA